MKNYEEIKKNLETRKDRSAWNKGVTVYALEMLDDVAESINYSGKEPETRAQLKALALNGAESWEEYSWGGSALIYNGDIAERLCSPSELKKTRGGERRPNSREEWLDTQARIISGLPPSGYRVENCEQITAAEDASPARYRAAVLPIRGIKEKERF